MDIHCQFVVEVLPRGSIHGGTEKLLLRPHTSSVSFNCHFDFYCRDAVSGQPRSLPALVVWPTRRQLVLLAGSRRGVEKGAKGDGTASIVVLRRSVNRFNRGEVGREWPCQRGVSTVHGDVKIYSCDSK